MLKILEKCIFHAVIILNKGQQEISFFLPIDIDESNSNQTYFLELVQ